MTKLVSGKQSINYRNYRRARDRALVRLSHAYPDTYKQLLEIERTFDEQEGKKWIGIAGLSTLTVGTHTRATGADAHTSSGDKQEDESDNGGKA